MKSRLIFTIIIILMSDAAFATQKPDSMTATIGAGYLFLAKKRDLKNTGIPAMFALAYNVDEKWSTQLAVNLVNANSDDASKQHVHGFIYLLDELYHFKSYRKLDPYFIAGFNVISLKPSGNTESINQGGLNVGIGTQFFESNNVALSVDARDMYTFVGGKNDILLNVGLNFIF